MSEETIALPKFDPDVPEHILDKMSTRDRWEAEQDSIRRQENRWFIQQLVNTNNRLAEGDNRFRRIETDLGRVTSIVDTIEKWRLIFTTKGGLVKVAAVWILSMLLIPIFLLILGAVFREVIAQVFNALFK